MTTTNDAAGCPTYSPSHHENAATDGASDDEPPPRRPASGLSVQERGANGSSGLERGVTGIFDSIDNLREIMGRCLVGKPLDGDLADWLGSALDGYLSRQFHTLEEAFGLIFPRGGIPWWREEAMRKRDAALRYLADTFLGDLAAGTQAHKIWTGAIRYAASAWRIDRGSYDMPKHYAGTFNRVPVAGLQIGRADADRRAPAPQHPGALGPSGVRNYTGFECPSPVA